MDTGYRLVGLLGRAQGQTWLAKQLRLYKFCFHQIPGSWNFTLSQPQCNYG